MATSDLTAARLRELVHYDPLTGVFTWLRPTSIRVKAGQVLERGRGHGAGYLFAGIDGRKYYLHRLAWLYMTGSWPSMKIDHRDTVTSNNRWLNLRDVASRTNSQNQRKATRKSKSGLLGASPHSCGNRWVATIRDSERQRYLGIFDTPNEAHEAYVFAKRQLHEGCTL